MHAPLSPIQFHQPCLELVQEEELPVATGTFSRRPGALGGPGAGSQARSGAGRADSMHVGMLARSRSPWSRHDGVSWAAGFPSPCLEGKRQGGCAIYSL